MMPLHYVGIFALPHSDAFSSKPKISDCYYVDFVDKQPTQEKNFGGHIGSPTTYANVNFQKKWFYVVPTEPGPT